MFDKPEPPDMFDAPTGSSGKPASQPPQAPSTAPATRPTPAPMPIIEQPRSGGRKLRKAIIVIVVLLLAATAAYLAFRYAMFRYQLANPPLTEGDDTPGLYDGSTQEETAPTEAEDEVPTLPEQKTAESLDSDGDGLSNALEAEAGTSVSVADTDGDGLGDREEVQVYGTDPLRTDTDADGYLDGSEVKAGYNPNGPGKLLEIPSSSD